MKFKTSKNVTGPSSNQETTEKSTTPTRGKKNRAEKKAKADRSDSQMEPIWLIDTINIEFGCDQE